MTESAASAAAAPGAAPAKRSLARRILFAVAAWALVAGVAEGILRLCGFAPETPAVLKARYDKFQADDELTWSLEPSWSGFELNGAAVRTNSFGLRGPEPAARDARTAARILFLGDSVTYGHFLSEDATIPSRVEASLRAVTASQAEVINAGVPGYSTFQQETLFRRHAKGLAPDLVLLGFCLNDVTERYATMAAWGGPRFFMMNVDTTVGMNPLARLWHATAIRNAAWTFLRSSGARGEGARIARLWTERDDPQIGRAWDTVLGEIDRLDAGVREARASFAVVIFPCEAQLADPAGTRRPQDVLLAHLAERGVPAIDLLTPLSEQRAAAGPLFLDATHFTPAGARLAAAEIARFVDGSRLLVRR